MKQYLAYGSNLNKAQMLRRCPGAKAIGTGYLDDYALIFRRSYLTIEPRDGSRVPVGVWAITDEDEKALDRYEGYPRFYDKDEFILPTKVGEDQGKTRSLIYIMNDGYPAEMPTSVYWNTCLQGYNDFGFDIEYLKDALEYTGEVMRNEGT